MHRARADRDPNPQRSQRRPRALEALAFFLLLLLSGGAVAQPAAESPVFSERIEVRLIHLDVLVTDAKGAPVLDLARKDFEVRADGEPVEISLFAAPAPNVTTSADEPPTADAPPARGGEWILYFDDERLLGAHRERVIRNLESTFGDWPSGTPIRLVFRRGMRSISEGPFTTPRETLAALQQRPKALARGVFGNRARERTLTNLADIRSACLASGRSPCIDCWNEQLSEVIGHAVEEVERIQGTVSGLANLLSSVDPRDGQRSLLYVGDGLPQIPGASVFWSLGDVCPDRRTEADNEAASYDQGRLLDQLGALANAQRVAFHTVDAGGLRPSFSQNDSDYIRNLQDGLLRLAKDTGGSAVLNANAPAKPVRAAVDLERSRYALGFTLEQPPSGRVYRLDIGLRGEARGHTLTYRRSFFDQRPQDRLLRRLGALLDPLTAGALDPEIGMEIVAVETVEKRLRKVSLRISMPAKRVILLPGPDGQSGRLGVALASADAKGRAQPARYQTIPVGANGLQLQDGLVQLTIGMSVPPGPRKFALAVLDETTGEEGFAALETEIP